jgi:hypothetical protein
MGLNIGALGNFAGGVAKGISAYQEQALRDKEMAMREETLGMQKKEFDWKQKEQDQKAEFNNLLQQAFGMTAPDKVGGTNINPTNFAGGLSYQNAQAIPMDDAAILAHVKTLPPEVADQITAKAKAAGDAASDPAEAQRLRTQAYKSLVAENMTPATALPVKSQTDLNTPAAPTPDSAVDPLSRGSLANITYQPVKASAEAIPAAALAPTPAETSATAALSNDPHLLKIQKLKDLAMKSGNSYALDKAMDMESKYTQTLANQQTIKVGDQTMTLNSYKIRQADTTEKFDQKFNAAMDDVRKTSAARLDQISEVAKSKGMEGLVSTFGPELKKALGHDVQFKNGAIVVLDDQGKPIGQPITNLDQAKGALQELAQTEYANNLKSKLMKEGLFRDEKELVTFLQKEQELKTHGISATAQTAQAAAATANAATSADELAAKKKAGTFEATANQANAAANASNANANLHNRLADVAKSNAEAGAAMKPYMEEFSKLTPEQQNGPEGQAVLLKAATAAAKKSGDITGLINALKKPDRSVVSSEERTAAYRDLENAVTPEQIEAVKEKWPNVFGEDPMVTAFKKAKGNDKTDKTDAGKNKSAIPVDSVEAGSFGGGGTYVGNPDKEAVAKQAKFKAAMDAETARIKAAREAKQNKSAIPVSADSSGAKSAGLIESGNINLTKRPVVTNKDGSISTVRSISFKPMDENVEVLIPTVVNGKIVSDNEAIAHYKKTGEHLGKFKTTEAANAYAEKLHKEQDRMYRKAGNNQ